MPCITKKAVSLLPPQGFEFFCPISLVDLRECGVAAPNSDGSSCPGRLDKLLSLNLNVKIDGEHVQKKADSQWDATSVLPR